MSNVGGCGRLLQHEQTKDNARPRSSDEEVTACRAKQIFLGHITVPEVFANSATLVMFTGDEMVSVSGGVLMLHAPPSCWFSETFVEAGVSPVTRKPPPWKFG